MQLILVICLLVTVAVAQEPSLSCRYFINFNQLYGCELTIDNPNGFNNFTEIGGIHLEGFTNDHLSEVYTYTSTTTNIPQIICDTFPNITLFDLYGSQIFEIDDNALSGCTKIRRLYLNFNGIRSISENAFVNLREVQYIDLGYNSLTTLPENVFGSQQNLTFLGLSYNSIVDSLAGLFRPLENLQYLEIEFCNITTINSQWFTENRRLSTLYLRGNRIELSVNMFAGLELLRFLYLPNNEINDIPAGAFTGLANLEILELFQNNLSELRTDSFIGLDRLTSLNIGSNPIELIAADALIGLDSLISLSMSNCRIRDLSTIAFSNLQNLTSLNLNFNEIEEIPPGTFASFPNLIYIGLWDNRLKTLRRDSFGTLTSLITLDLDGNIVNALDRAIVDDAVNLQTLYFDRNLCASNYFGSFHINRPTYLVMLETCFRNMRYIVDTITENDGVYSFFEGTQPGIALRVQSDNEIQIALTPFDFVWAPMIEIFIGSTNNTRSVIRINQQTNVVTVPTVNIIQPNQWNDFRVTWMNQNVLVFFGNENYPFMSYTMQDYFPINFYGLRAVETRATWSVQRIS